ncbi:MAG: alanine racemase [Treponematales bacterium]
MPVKANAYGHGAVETARAALEEGAAFLAVAAVSEAACLRAAGIDAPLLLLSPALPEELPELAALELRPFVSCAEDIDALDNAAAGSGKRLPVHLKIDTGMGRVGCTPEKAEGLARRIAGSRRLFLEGVATHLSAADSPAPDDMRWTARQLARFGEAVSAIRAAGIDPGILHAANSGALVFHPEALFDMARPGIALYGYSPAPEHPLALPVTPVMELRSAVVFIKRARRGEAVSYGRTWTAHEDTFIATVPAGYGDGLPRRLGGAGFSVLVGGERRPVVGRVCMDQFMVDLGPETCVKRGDPVVIFGTGAAAGGGSPNIAADIARLAGTIPYEITTAIASRVPRVYED